MTFGPICTTFLCSTVGYSVHTTIPVYQYNYVHRLEVLNSYLRGELQKRKSASVQIGGGKVLGLGWWSVVW